MDTVAQRVEELQREIGRRRRRIDARLVNLQRESQRLTCWQTYVQHFPGTATLGALVLGLTLSGGLSWGLWQRWLGMRFMAVTTRAAGRWLVGEIEYLWAGDDEVDDEG